MDDDFAALGTGARDLLAAKGPLPLEALAGLLDVPPAVLRQAMEAHPHMLPAPGGEWVSGLRLADSVAFTHELSAAEVARGMLSGDDDLALWAVFATAGLPLAAGGEAGAASAQDLPPGPGDDLPVGQGMIGQFITGPDGWLAGYSAGDLLSARLRDGALEISGQEPPAPGPGTVRLRDACASAAVQALEDYGRGAAAQPFAPLDGILVRRLFTEPGVFASPQPPLASTLRAAGLESFGGCVGVRGTSWNLARISRLDRSEAVAGTKAMGLLLAGDSGNALTHLTSSPAITAYVADEVERRTAEGASFGSQLTMLGQAAVTAPERAAVALLQARSAEGAGDPVTAERLTGEALAAQPDLRPALMDGGEYAACRGDVHAADRYLRRADQPVAEMLRTALSRQMAPPKPTRGRNQPCPCGSGRKYKVCCLAKAVHPLPDRVETLYALLATYAQRAACAETLSRLLTRSGSTEHAALCCVDLVLTDCGATERFLRARGGWLRDDERRLAESWQHIPIGLFEVRKVQRGVGVTVRPLHGGEPTFLKDRLFSASARRLDLFCGRILHDGTRARLLALPVRIDRAERAELLALLNSGPSAQELAEFVAPRPAPCLQNADGHDYCDAEVVWEVPDEPTSWTRLARHLKATDADCLELLADSGGKTVSRGRVTRERARWTLLVNSRERLAEFEKIVRAAAPAAREVRRKAERIGGDPHRRARSLMVESYLLDASPDPERQSARMQAGSWVDKTIDGLGMTPREAARAGEDARTELEMLVDDLEWRNDGQAEAGKPALMDVAWIRRELGIPTAR